MAHKEMLRYDDVLGGTVAATGAVLVLVVVAALGSAWLRLRSPLAEALAVYLTRSKNLEYDKFSDMLLHEPCSSAWLLVRDLPHSPYTDGRLLIGAAVGEPGKAILGGGEAYARRT